jgi:hypothetical protein
MYWGWALWSGGRRVGGAPQVAERTQPEKSGANYQSATDPSTCQSDGW